MTTAAKITAIAPWFGSKRTLAQTIVTELGPHRYYLEACAGSMAVLFSKYPCDHETACDLHGALTNMAWVIQDEHFAVLLFNRLQRVAYSDALYLESKKWIEEWEASEKPIDPEIHEGNFLPSPFCRDVDWAYNYFIASWMGRNGDAGTSRVNYQIATRWTQGGGSGPLRFRNAVDSIPVWCQRLKKVHILRRDIFKVIDKVEDAEGVAIYADPPYFRETRSEHGYVHDFTPAQHVALAKALRRFTKARVVVSYYAHPRLADLYPYPDWTMIDCYRQKHLAVQNKRGMGRKVAPEVLLLNGPSLSGAVDLFLA